MKIHVSLGVLTTSFLVVLGPTAVAQDQTANSAVTRVVQGFADAWNLHDMEAFGHLFAPDADFINVVGDRWKGRAAIQKNHAYVHGVIPASDRTDVTAPTEAYGIFKKSTLMFTGIDVRFLPADIAIAHARWRLTGHGPSGPARTTEPRTGIMTFVLARTGTAWEVETAQNTETRGR